MLDEANQELEALLQFIYMAPIGLARTTVAGEIVMINPLCSQLLMPLAPAGMLVNLFTTLEGVIPDLRHRVETFGLRNGMVCEGLRVPIRATCQQRGEARILSLTLLKLDADSMMAVLDDVTRAEQRERQLRDSQAWFNAIVTGISDYSLMTLDHEGRVVDWNESVGRLTGHDESAAGQSFAQFYPPGTLPPERQLDRLRDADDNGWSLDEGWCMRADGSRFWGGSLIAPLHACGEELAAASPVLEPVQERAYSLIIRDIGDKRESLEALKQAMYSDHLTGLANRRAFFDAAEAEVERWQRSPRKLSLIIFDADHFKAINDLHGHPAGDAVLRQLASVLRSSFQEVDLIARIGGEEFAVLLPGTDLEEGWSLANRVCARIAALPVEVDGKRITCTVSAGIARMDASVPDLDTLIKSADKALYCAKADGRNRAEIWRGNTAEQACLAEAAGTTP